MNMNYERAHNFFISLNNVPRQKISKKGRRAGLHFKRLKHFLKLLGSPQNNIPRCIHVAGTSGKGSVCRMLEKILRDAGYKTGVLTSPHEFFITERWRLDGRNMNKREFAALVEKIKPALDRAAEFHGGLPTFFELNTALGLWWFAAKKADIAIIEAGVGGRGDSTNIIPRKTAAVITNIGRDHASLIGPSKTDIAREKAGIIKPGCRVFTAEKNKRMLAIIKAACRKNRAPFYRTYKSYGSNRTYVPAHQMTNAALAAAVAGLFGIERQAAMRSALGARLPLRFEIKKGRPMTVFDGAHNPEKMATTVEAAKNLKDKLGLKKLTLLIGFSADKDVKKMLRQLSVLKPTAVAVARNTVNPFRRVADPKKIKQTAVKQFHGAEIKIFLDPLDAFGWAKKRCGKNGLLLVTGSIFLTGELKRLT